MRQNSFIKNLMLSLFVSLGLFISIVLVFALGGKGGQSHSGVWVLLASAGFFSAAAIYLFKKKNVLKHPGSEKEHSQVGFMVDTFQELVAKLKEKEKELERLKAFAEERAVSIEAYNENVLQSVPSGVISIDKEMKIKSINQAAEHILDMKAGNILDRQFSEVFSDPLVSLISSDQIVSRAEYPYVTGEGRHIWLGITTSELRNAAGEKMGLICVFTDLTEIKALEAQIQLKERLSQLGEMSAGIAHELRNSMSVIAGYSKLLGRKVDPASKGTADAISDEIKNMDSIISELLAFAKPTVLNMERVDLHELIQETIESVSGVSDKVRVAIHSEGQVLAKADIVLLRQALSNLIINAVEAMPEGGSIDIGLRRVQNKAELSVRDTGHGIPEDIRQKIFLPFYTTKPQGTGFGLALVQKIIVSHGGSIGVESREGEGTVFTIVFPSIE